MKWKIAFAGIVLALYIYLIFIQGKNFTASIAKKVDAGEITYSASLSQAEIDEVKKAE